MDWGPQLWKYRTFYNTYKGWGLESGLNVSLRAGNSAKGGFTGGLSLSLNNNTDGLTITPGLSVSLTNYGEADKEGITGSLSTSMSYNTRAGLKGMQLNTGVGMSRRKIVESIELHGSGAINKSFISQGGISTDIFSSSISFAASSYTPTITLPYTSKQITFTGRLEENYGVWMGMYF